MPFAHRHPVLSAHEYGSAYAHPADSASPASDHNNDNGNMMTIAPSPDSVPCWANNDGNDVDYANDNNTVVQLIHATFDIFDTEPRTWQLDFDEFCHWLETGERVLNSHGIMKVAASSTAAAAEGQPAKGVITACTNVQDIRELVFGVPQSTFPDHHAWLRATSAFARSWRCALIDFVRWFGMLAVPTFF